MPILQMTTSLKRRRRLSARKSFIHRPLTQQLAPKMDTAFWSSSDGSSNEEEEEGRASDEQVSTMAAFAKATTAKASIGADVKQNYLSTSRDNSFEEPTAENATYSLAKKLQSLPVKDPVRPLANALVKSIAYAPVKAPIRPPVKVPPDASIAATVNIPVFLPVNMEDAKAEKNKARTAVDGLAVKEEESAPLEKECVSNDKPLGNLVVNAETKKRAECNVKTEVAALLEGEKDSPANATGGEPTLEHESAAISIQHDDLMAGEKSTVGTTTVDAATIDCQNKMDPNIIRQNVTKEEKSSVCEFVASVVKTDHEKLGELEDEKSIDHSGVHLMAKDIEADYLVPENSSAGDSLGPARTPQESMQPVQPGDSLADEQERCGDLSIPLFDLDPETSSTAAVVTSDSSTETTAESSGEDKGPTETLREQTGRGNTQHDDSMVGEQSIVRATIADSETIDCDKKIDRNIVKQNAMKEEKPSICDFMAQVAKTDHETREELEGEKSIDYGDVHLIAKDVKADDLIHEKSSAGDSSGPASKQQESLRTVQQGDSFANEQERSGNLSNPLFDVDRETSSTAAVVTSEKPSGWDSSTDTTVDSSGEDKGPSEKPHAQIGPTSSETCELQEFKLGFYVCRGEEANR